MEGRVLTKKLKDSKKAVIESLRAAYGDVVSRKQILEHCQQTQTDVPYWLMYMKGHRTGWGQYDLAQILAADANLNVQVVEQPVENTTISA